MVGQRYQIPNQVTPQNCTSETEIFQIGIHRRRPFARIELLYTDSKAFFVQVHAGLRSANHGRC